MEKEIVGGVLITLLGGFIGYFFSRKGKGEEELTARVADLEKKVAELAIGQRDVVHIKETQDRLVKDLQEILRILTDIRIEHGWSNRKGDRDGD